MLSLPGALPRLAAGRLRHVLERLPALRGDPITLCFLPRLSASGGSLLSASRRGVAVHAGSAIRERRMVLDRDLLESPAELERIFLHELFHFVWFRLGNPLRRGWEDLLSNEWDHRARGELGWSAEWRKAEMEAGWVACRSRKWREYVCESFCDTAAWLLGCTRRHAEFTLARTHCERRRAWFRHLLVRACISI